MSPSIRITEEIQQVLAELKRDDETFEELLDRLLVEDESDITGDAGTDIEAQMEAIQEELAESPEANNDR